MILIYLDYAATTPMSQKAIDVYSSTAQNMFANSASLHDLGEQSSRLLSSCRSILAGLIKGRAEGIYFTGGGSEANVLAIGSLLNASDSRKKHIISSRLEHASILSYLKKLEYEGYMVTYLNPEADGRIAISTIREALTEETVLATIQHANSELGVIQDIKEIGRVLKENGVLFHSDCVQTYCKIPIDMRNWNVDAISFSSHKVYGPKGTGAVYISPGVYWKPLLPDTTHESGFRAGTVDLPAIAAFTQASVDTCSEMEEQLKKAQKLREYLIQEVQEEKLPLILLNAEDPSFQLPYIFALMLEGYEGQYVLLHCNSRHLAISTGTACQAGMLDPSKAITAIGISADRALQYFRVSIGKQTSKEDLQHLLTALKNIDEKELQHD
ncbi:aminotransferase class V-fold PLP-dependent enzyme [Bacillus lacus]|uniref:Aminotransferase class V-fold PLP-dependent enzyme n=1 Tax=Metabacillus lacus TaxID=1983721 RepID=A0A7X2LYZ2_9BACI|nr:IscS subfamily cysteine desulfurase [Metabacillus lacus]MRX71407.1 aminotransferase class V-fold PLP-dependent enzyme [Metabacillus lacus]